MKEVVKFLLPYPVWNLLKKGIFRLGGRPRVPGETAKAHDRRVREGFFDLYCKGRGLDIGFGGDPVVPGVQGFDFEHGDAQYLATVKDSTFDFVYASHTLEHMVDPRVALRNWWRVLRPNGYLLLLVPDRELYEKRLTLPSQWNSDHKTFFMLDAHEAPDTVGMRALITETLNDAEIISVRRCDEGYQRQGSDHPTGEYSIEAVIRKRAPAVPRS